MIARKPRSRLSLVWAVGLVCALGNGAKAFAQKKSDPHVAAAQAISKFDYQNAYKLAMEGLKSQPQNLETRRIAAKSAKELQKPGDCLRVMSVFASASSAVKLEDVQLIGECGSGAEFPAWTLSFLSSQANNNSNANTKDAASYWLGKYHYRRSDYTKALEFLTSVNLLPARLEKDRQFMMERSKEVVASLAKETQTAEERPPQPTRAQTAQRLPAPPRTSSQNSETPSALRQNQGPAAGADPSSNAGFSSPEPQNGWVVRTSVFADLEVFTQRGSSVLIGAGQQKPYEVQLNTPRPGDAVGKIETTEYKGMEFNGQGLVKFGTYYLWNPSPLDAKTTPNHWAFKTQLSASQASLTSVFGESLYADPGQSQHPSQSPHQTQKGWSIGLGSELFLRPLKNLKIEVDSTPALASPSWKGTTALFPGSLKLSVKMGLAEVALKTKGTLLFGKNKQVGAWSSETSVDVGLQKVGFLSIRNEPDYPLFRWTRIRPKGSDLVVQYTTMEGDFYEFNFTPRFHLTDILEVAFWYRYTTSTKQSYVGSADKESIENQGNNSGSWELFRPTAEYTAASNDYALIAKWELKKNISLLAKAVVRKSISQYYEAKDGVENLNYAGLLDRAGDDWTRFSIGAKLEF